MIRVTMRLTPLILSVCTALLLLSGCSRFKPPADFEHMDSVNVGLLPDDWPQGYDLTEAQQEVFDERGRPHCVRARWTHRDELTWGDQLWTRFRRQRIIDIMAWHHHRNLEMPFELSWIYQEEGQARRRQDPQDFFRGEEVIFTSDTTWETEPLSDQMGIIIDNGDPEERRAPEDWNGHLLERWIYFERGRVYHFIDGTLTSVEIIAPTPIRVRREM